MKYFVKEQPELIIELNEAIILWNFAFQTNKKAKNNRTDIDVKEH